MHPNFRKAIPDEKRCSRCPLCGAPIGSCEHSLRDRAEQPEHEVTYVGSEPSKEELEEAIREEFERTAG